jgi:hypothetical protein
MVPYKIGMLKKSWPYAIQVSARRKTLSKPRRNINLGFGQRGEESAPHDTQYKFSCGGEVQVVVSLVSPPPAPKMSLRRFRRLRLEQTQDALVGLVRKAKRLNRDLLTCLESSKRCAFLVDVGKCKEV